MLDRLRSALDLRHPRYRSVLRNREGGRTILALLGVLLAVAAVLFVIGRIDTMRRSGTAAVIIVSTRFQPGSAGMRETPQGSQIEYQYTVNGTTYVGADFRSWTNVPAHEPKVCYEPADPTNHLLVDGRIRCGIDGGP
ncbi:MAG TPA: hypothetical protein VK194_11135 [Candidatus Deferrimicrobium sp.]|nr:hypothetical protein [Candidatus Deferrimicrobium sp.]